MRGLMLQKYAVNNPDKFMSWQKAFMFGFLQMSITILVETVNMLVILQSTTTQDIVFNFIAVAIISDFDNFVFNSLRNEPLKELVSEENGAELMQISFTTSSKAKTFEQGGEASDMVNENGEPICMKISFVKDRSCANKLFRMVYKLGRIFFVSVYFYFYPAMAVWCTFQIPLFFRTREKSSYVTMTNSFWVPGVDMTPMDYMRLNITETDYMQY